VLKDLGIDVTVGGFLGKDNQDGFQQLFSELGIANRFQVVQGRTRINVKLTEKDGEVTDFNFSGFEVTPGDWERFVNDSLSWLGQFDMVCVSGSLPSGVSPEAFTDWMTRLRSQCPCIIFDSSREALVAGLKAAPWLVKPNRRELEIWAGRKLPEMKDVIEAAHALREQGLPTWLSPLAKKALCGLTHPASGLPNRLQLKWSAPLAPVIPWLAA
jgi:1-phosphofructokinase